MLKNKIKIALITLVIAILFATGAAFAAPMSYPSAYDAEPDSALFVGNSFFFYNNGIQKEVSAFARAGGNDLRTNLLTISSSYLYWHDLNAYLQPGGVGSRPVLGKDGQVRIVSNSKKDNPYDLVIMMDNSNGPIGKASKEIFQDTAAEYSKIARAKGVKPVFFMSWAYTDRPEMTEPLAQAYIKAAKANNALLVPAGLAFARVTKERPDIVLRIKDGRHPTPAGTYLAAATIYATIYQKSPIQNTYNGSIDPQTAQYLKQVAWETVREFYGLQAARPLGQPIIRKSDD